MLARRRLASGICAAGALFPAVLWLLPALTARLAPSYRDQGDFFYPLKLYTVQRLASGEVPLWNPLSGAGEPWLANGQSGVFYPPTLLFLLPSAALAGALFLLLHFAIAAWGARRFLKGENVSDSGALLGAAAFAASGFAASFAAYWNHFGAWAYLPAIASLARSGLRSRASVLGFGTLVGLQAMAGSPEMSAVTIAMAAALALFPREPFPEPLAPASRWRGLARCGAGIGLGLLLAAWVLVPMGELALHSDRREPLPSAHRSLGAASGRDLLSLAGFAPAWSGNAYLATVFLPPFALVTAAAAFREGHRRRLALLLLAFALFGVLAAMQAPPGTWLRELPFFDRVRFPAKWLAFTSFGLAMLAGMGLDSLRFQTGEGRIRGVFGALATAALALAALSPLPLPVRLACGIGSAAVGLLALGAGRARPAGTILAATACAALVAALALELSAIARFAPESEIVSCPEPVTALSRIAGRVVTPPMAALAGWVLRDGQFDGPMLSRQREALLGYTNLPCRVPSVRTAAAMRTAAADRIESSIGAADDALPAGAASARVLWTPFRPVRLPSRQVGQFFRAPIAPYRPRLSFVSSYRVEPDSERAWSRVAAGEIDLTREVLLDRRPSPDPAGASAAPLLLARLAEDRPERVVAELTSSLPGLLVLTDLHYPGWIAEEEGKRLPMLRADGWFRAVSLPAGTHRVVFRYRPLSFYAGAALSVATLLMILILWHAGEPIPTGGRRS